VETLLEYARDDVTQQSRGQHKQSKKNQDAHHAILAD
jgi:hypothetical protein